jgi:pimeloyl-ACP methyl ester carboxylesterase
MNIANALSEVSYRTVRVDDLDIFYREAGPKDGPMILLLHGLPSSSRMYQPLLESDLANQYHLIARTIPALDIRPGRITKASLTPSIIWRRSCRKLVYTTANLTSMLLRVALEYGQT